MGFYLFLSLSVCLSVFPSPCLFASVFLSVSVLVCGAFCGCVVWSCVLCGVREAGGGGERVGVEWCVDWFRLVCVRKRS